MKKSMKDRIITLAAVMMLLCTGCSSLPQAESGTDTQPESNSPAQEYYIQEIAHLHLEEALQEMTADTAETSDTETVRAVWIPVMLYADWMTGKSETDFREAVQTAFHNCADFGLNTVYLHVRAYCDAYYRSDIFPRGAYWDGEYDPLAVMLEEARACGLAVHAWINPMRAQTPHQLSALDKSYLLRQWYDDPEKNGTYLINYEDRYYLNPAYPEIRQLIADGVAEILEKYDVDGIHIDDYFYPTTDENFDAQAFAEYSQENPGADLAQWRRDNCSEMVKCIYQTVKENNPDIPFSISPQGNPDSNYNTLYADTERWCSEPGFCDCIIPQLYYGFENETCPFAETAAYWIKTATATDLVIGLAAYKIGTEDQWAGKGHLEFLTDNAVIAKEVAWCNAQDGIDGIALYSYSSVFEPEQAVSALVRTEKEQIESQIKNQLATSAS